MNPIFPGILAASLALFSAACLPAPRAGCRTTDDCVAGRVCFSGLCRPSPQDASLEALSEEQASPEVASEVLGTMFPDTASEIDSTPHDVDVAHQDVSSVAMGGGSDKLVDSEVNANTQTTMNEEVGLPERMVPDYANSTDATLDLPLLMADAAPDTPVASTVDGSAGSDAPDRADASNEQTDETGNLAPDLVSWESFRAKSPREPWAGGRYIVDGDLAFDEAGLRHYYDAWFAALGAAPTDLAPMGATDVWAFPDSFLLSYCISTAFGENLAFVEAAMQVATASWSDRVGVNFTYISEENANCNADNAKITFDVRPVIGANYAAVSFFPDSVRTARSLLLDASVFTVTPDGVDLEATLRHQLGHTLGFSHEHLWLDPTCKSNDYQLAVRIADYDIDSVMHMPTCRSAETGGTIQAEDDFVKSTLIYGLSPALISVTGI